MTSARFLGMCGLISSLCVMAAAGEPRLLFAAGLVMTIGNAYALMKG